MHSGPFTQQDPIGIAGGLNLYGYADGDPVNFSDPFGLDPCPPDCTSGELGWMALGSAVGFWVGGGSGLVLGSETGPGAVLTATAGARVGATVGAAIGLGIANAIDTRIQFFSRGDGSSDPAAGLRRQLRENERRLERYKANPDAFDNKGFLRNAPNAEIRESIIQGRRKLQSQIEDFLKQISDITGGGS